MGCGILIRCLLWFHRKLSDEPPSAITDEIARTVEEGNARAPLISESWDNEDGGAGSSLHIRELGEENNRLQTDLAREREQVTDLHATIARFKAVIAERNDRISHLENELQAQKKSCEEAQQEGVRRDEQIRQLQNAAQEERARALELERDLQTCIAEREDAMNRLSQMVSVQVRDSNAAIVDLSDAYRPEKLAELSNNIYDNAWLDALDGLENDDIVGCVGEEKECIRLLLDVVMESFTFCNQLGKLQLDYVNNWMITDSDDSNIKTSQKLLKDSRKQKALQLLPAVEERHLKASLWVKLLKDSRKQKALQLLPAVEEKCVARVKHCLSRSNVDLAACATLQAYTSECIKLCWLMAVQDPPCILVCPGWNPAPQSATIKHDDTEFPIPYPTNTPNHGFVHDGSSSKNGDYLQSDKLVFDRSLFSEYTGRGKYVDYIVWPCMRLHEGGQILSKGVAQGCD